MTPTLDAQNTEILSSRQAAFTARTKIKAGDFIDMPDGTTKRVAHVWTDENDQPEDIQPTLYAGDESFYLGNGYMSFSGGLMQGISAAKFHRTEETRLGRAWFFNHDYATAHNGIYVQVLCPVWKLEA